MEEIRLMMGDVEVVLFPGIRQVVIIGSGVTTSFVINDKWKLQETANRMKIAQEALNANINP